MTAARTRRPPKESRRLILDAAAGLLAEGGVAAVQVRAVAARVGMTDAGVKHHFGSRDNLLRELLRHGGRQLKAAVTEVLQRSLAEDADLDNVVDGLAAVYRRGYGALAVALHTAGWRDRGGGMLDPLVDALHHLRTDNAPVEETRLAVAAMHQAIATEPLYGPAFRRSAGLAAAAANDPGPQLRWWARQLRHALGLTPPTDGAHDCHI